MNLSLNPSYDGDSSSDEEQDNDHSHTQEEVVQVESPKRPKFSNWFQDNKYPIYIFLFGLIIVSLYVLFRLYIFKAEEIHENHETNATLEYAIDK